VNEKKAKNAKPKREGNRAGILKAITTPLGFFALATLIVEALLVALAWTLDLSARRIAVFILIGLLVVIVAGVFLIAIYRPEALYGLRAAKATDHDDRPLKVGERVRIRSDIAGQDVVTDDAVIAWNPKMKPHLGKETRILAFEKNPRAYRLEIDDERYQWAPQWLERHE
jgi:hypothetical protein